jgi:hypothetical protein
MPTFCSVVELVPEFQVARLDVAELFRRNAPLHVDLGCGDGSFLCQMAQQFPNTNFLGVERLTKRVEKVRRKAEKIENVRVLCADSLFVVRYVLPESSVETFYLLFPDPWPNLRRTGPRRPRQARRSGRAGNKAKKPSGARVCSRGTRSHTEPARALAPGREVRVSGPRAGR